MKLLEGKTIAITGGRVVVGDGSPPVDGGTVVIRDGRVVAAGAGVSVPAGATVVDASGKWVTPGIVAGFSRIGLVEVDAVDETNDTQANNSPFNAAIDVAPAINPQASTIAINRAAGVTRAVVSPGYVQLDPASVAVRSSRRKSPARMSGCATSTDGPPLGRLPRVTSMLKKKKSFGSLKLETPQSGMGPLTLPPNWFKRSLAFVAASGARASSASLRRNS